MKNFRWLVVLAAAACAPLAPASGPRAAADAAPVLLGDTAVITGTLENGLRYYVRANAEPPARAELRLVVNAGSILEDDDQRGLAHFLEHMAFTGTERFRKHEIVDYLESVGMRFGPDVNAYTSFDETVYMLTLPTDSAGVLETGIRILEDWAGAMLLDTAEIRRERGVVIEELRRQRGAGARVRDVQFPFLYAGSRYAERLPIGDLETLRTFEREALARFYRDWYRPELMAVVAVGDFDAEAVAARIRESFSGLRGPGDPRPRVEHTVPLEAGTRFSVVADPELTATLVTLDHTMPARRDGALEGYRRGVVAGMYAGMLGGRLNTLSLQPDAPFLDVSSYHGTALRTADAFVLTARVPEGGAEAGLAAVAAEAERAARHGFTPAELARERARAMRAWEQIHAERDNATSAEFASRYASHFLYGGPLRTTEDEYALQRWLLPRITLEEVNAAAREWLQGTRRTVLVTVPAGPGTVAPTEAGLAAALERAVTGELAAHVDTVSDAPLLAELPPPGRVVAADTVAELGLHRWTLSNGARVVLLPTDYRDDEILFAGRSDGGTSLLPDSLFLHGRAAVAAVQLGGIGALSLDDLQKRLAGRAASVGMNVSDLTQGVSGYASPGDLETMFQLLHLYFTAPRRDTAAWEAFLQRGRETFRNRAASPEAHFADTLNAVLTGNHPRARSFTAATYDSLDLDRALAVYRDRFADPGAFTYYMVGSFDPEGVRPLVERYLASLPGRGREDAWRDVGIEPPDGIVRRTVRRGMEDRARTRIVFSGPVDFSRETVSALRSLGDALQIRLREVLREEMGGTYGVSVGGAAERDPRARYRFVVDFETDPARLDEMTAAVFAEIAAVQADGVAEDVVVRVREGQRRSREVALRDNGVWLGQLMTYDRYGWDPRLIPGPPPAAGLTAEDVRAAARRFLDTTRYVQVSLVPEGAASAAAP
jgi:zinc protease